MGLRKVNIAQSKYYFVDNYFDSLTQITESKYNELKTKPSAATMEFL